MPRRAQTVALQVFTLRSRSADRDFLNKYSLSRYQEWKRLPPSDWTRWKLLFGAVPSDENSPTVKKAAVPFLIALRNKLAHRELTGVVIDGPACYLSINVTSTFERALRRGHDGSRLPSFDLHIWYPKTLATCENLIGGTTAFGLSGH
jgi:hypothetical protein